MTYTLTVFGEERRFRSLDRAISAARKAERTYAAGFVQIHDAAGNLVYGQPR